MQKERKYWGQAIKINCEAGNPLRCIYTGEVLLPRKYDVDHFIPWSFVSHNQLWNLIPVNSGANRSKNDGLPNIDRYLEQYVRFHKMVIESYLNLNHKPKIFEDYAVGLHCRPEEMVAMEETDLIRLFRENFVTMEQIAEKMGFPSNWEYRA